MKQQQPLVRCPQCNCRVHFDRLEKHLRKAHRFSAERANRRSQMLGDIHKFKEVCVLIESFLIGRGIFLESLEDIEDFSLMAFERLLGYTIEEVITIGGIQNRATYKFNSKRLQNAFSPLIKPLSTLLKQYKKKQLPTSLILLSSDNEERRSVLEPLNNSHTENRREVKRSSRSTKQQRLSRQKGKCRSLVSSRSSSERIGPGYHPYIGKHCSSTLKKLDKNNTSSEHFSYRRSSSRPSSGCCHFCEKPSMYGADVCYTCNTD